MGTVNKTRTGKPCRVWSNDDVHSHDYHWVGDHNHCRNPPSTPSGGRWRVGGKVAKSAWCYTTDPGTYPKIHWDYCDIRDCTDCDQGKVQYHWVNLFCQINILDHICHHLLFSLVQAASQVPSPRFGPK